MRGIRKTNETMEGPVRQDKGVFVVEMCGRAMKYKLFSVDRNKQIAIHAKRNFLQGYLKIVPRAKMGSESIAHEAEVRMYYYRKSDVMRARRIIVFIKIQVVGQKNLEPKHLAQVKASLNFCFASQI